MEDQGRRQAPTHESEDEPLGWITPTIGFLFFGGMFVAAVDRHGLSGLWLVAEAVLILVIGAIVLLVLQSFGRASRVAWAIVTVGWTGLVVTANLLHGSGAGSVAEAFVAVVVTSTIVCSAVVGLTRFVREARAGFKEGRTPAVRP
jgi:hypothetical protein